MKTANRTAFMVPLVSVLLGAFATPLLAWEPNARELEDAIQRGDFTAYQDHATAWLNQRVPLAATESALATLLKDPVLLRVLDQRQLIAKVGADKLGDFAKEGPDHREFLAWLLMNTPALELFLEGAVPIGLAARERNDYTLNPASLAIWQKIVKADPDARDGICLKLAIATALAPPGSVNIGAGGAATPAEPVVRYQYFKTAHRNKELFPSFDHLTVWEYTKIVCSGASDADLTWAREMVNSFRPDLRIDEMVVNSTSLVWRRSAPPQFYPNGGYQNFKNVLAGGGKCGPRSSWSQMVCHAFGIPAIGVGQPAHACVAYKAANPMTQPQPGSAWKVGFGAGWDKSKLEGMRGPEFLVGIEKRSDAAKFSQVEHLRWLASALVTADKAAVVMAVARKINDSITAAKTDLTASLKPEEAEADPGVKAAGKGNHRNEAINETAANKPGAVAKAVSGLLHVDAASYSKTGGKISWGGQFPNILVHDSFGGGKQVYFQQQMKEQWADYTIDVPASGTCQIVMKAACINEDQLLEVCSGDKVIATVPIALSFGLWQETKPVELKLERGRQTLRIQTPVSLNAENHKRGIALKWFELKAPE